MSDEREQRATGVNNVSDKLMRYGIKMRTTRNPWNDYEEALLLPAERGEAYLVSDVDALLAERERAVDIMADLAESRRLENARLNERIAGLERQLIEVGHIVLGCDGERCRVEHLAFTVSDIRTVYEETVTSRQYIEDALTPLAEIGKRIVLGVKLDDAGGSETADDEYEAAREMARAYLATEAEKEGK